MYKYKYLFVFIIISFNFACGQNLYKNFTKNNNNDAVLQDAINAMDNNDYDTAVVKMKGLWEKEHSDQHAKFYATALAGAAGLNIFSILKNVILGVSDTSTLGKEDSALNKFSLYAPTNLSTQQLEYLTTAINILDNAPGKETAGIITQRCLTAALYGATSMNTIQTKINAIEAMLASLPGRLEVSGSSCGASTSTIDAVAEDFQNTLNSIDSLNLALNDLSAILGNCLPEGTQKSTDGIDQKVNNIVAQADKGCPSLPVLPSGAPLPNCMSDSFNSTTTNVQAGDGKIAGCELMTNCSGGKCF